jgi:hypothetical protein
MRSSECRRTLRLCGFFPSRPSCQFRLYLEVEESRGRASVSRYDWHGSEVVHIGLQAPSGVFDEQVMNQVHFPVHLRPFSTLSQA